MANDSCTDERLPELRRERELRSHGLRQETPAIQMIGQNALDLFRIHHHVTLVPWQRAQR